MSRRRSLRESRPSRPLRQRELGALAGDEVLELVGERAARAEEERLERRGRDPQQLGDLLVGTAFELPHHERLALSGRDSLQGLHEIVELDLVVGRSGSDVAHELDLGRARGGLAPALPDEVVSDREEPARRVPGVLAALECAERVHERRLRDVLCVGVVAEHGVRVAIDVADVPAVEVVERGVGARALFGRGHRVDSYDRPFSRRRHPHHRFLTNERASFALRRASSQ